MQDDRVAETLPRVALAQETILQPVLSLEVDEVVVVLDEVVLLQPVAGGSGGDDGSGNAQPLAHDARLPVERVPLGLLVHDFLRRQQKLSEYEPVRADVESLARLFVDALSLVSDGVREVGLLVLARDSLDGVSVPPDVVERVHVEVGHRFLLQQALHEGKVPRGDVLVLLLLVLSVKKVCLRDEQGGFDVELALHRHDGRLRAGGHSLAFGVANDRKRVGSFSLLFGVQR